MAETWRARLERPGAGPLLHMRIGEQVEHLKQEPTWRTGDRNAITLTKGSTVRVVLIVLKKGATLHDHWVGGPITIQAISGSERRAASIVAGPEVAANA
jgi:hypothetical protein